MSQHDYVLENLAGAGFRADLNEALAAIVTNNSGATEPDTTYPHMWWADTSAGMLKRRNAADDDWISVMSLDLAISEFAETVLAAADAADARTALGAAKSGSNDDITALTALTSINGGQLAGLRNRIINGNFQVNQRAKAGTVTLAAGEYGHDRWKAGASGCTYTFATSGIDTVITISSGSLMQVIEGANVEGGVYRLSHAGTAQARIAVNGASTSGSYAATPLSSASATGGQALTVEFTTGTVSKVQLEPGTVATTFERRPYGAELALCQRYYQVGHVYFLINGSNGISFGSRFPYLAQLRASGTVTLSNTTYQNATTLNITENDVYGLTLTAVGTAAGGNRFISDYTVSAEL